MVCLQGAEKKWSMACQSVMVRLVVLIINITSCYTVKLWTGLQSFVSKCQCCERAVWPVWNVFWCWALVTTLDWSLLSPNHIACKSLLHVVARVVAVLQTALLCSDMRWPFQRTSRCWHYKATAMQLQCCIVSCTGCSMSFACHMHTRSATWPAYMHELHYM